MISMFGIDWCALDGSTSFDSVLSDSLGAAALFGVTGGVKEATATISGVELKIAVCSGIASAKELIESGDYKEFSFIGVMACLYGCIGGGRMSKTYSRNDVENRAKTIYKLDKNSTKKTSNDNSELKQVYANFIGKPCGKKAHELLHTSYAVQTSPYLEKIRNSK